MSDLDPTRLLFQLDTASTFALFWYVLFFDLPRYTLGFLAIAVSELIGFRRSSRGWSVSPLVTVVLAGHNENQSVRRCVESLRQQKYGRLEIICIDDGSRDGMNRELRAMRDDRLIDAALSTAVRCGKSSALNLGISCARGDIVVITDCDCTFDRDAIQLLIRPFADAAVGAVAGNLGVRNADAGVLAAVQTLEYLLNISVGRRLLDMFGQVSCASGALAAFRRRALTEVGGLDVGPGEDLDLTLRLRNAGWKVRFAETAWCLTDAPETPRAFVRQRLRWERDALRLRLRKHRRSLDPRDISANMSELFHQLEFVLTHLGATLAFPFYLIWLVYNFGSGALTVLVVVTLVYAGLDVIAMTCALAVVDRPGFVKLFPYLPLYGPYHAYLLRAIRLVAYVQEWIFDASRRDRYVPMRVAKKAPFY